MKKILRTTELKHMLESNGVNVTHLVIIKPKGRFSVRTAKIIVTPQYLNAMYETEFFLKGSGAKMAQRTAVE